MPTHDFHKPGQPNGTRDPQPADKSFREGFDATSGERFLMGLQLPCGGHPEPARWSQAEWVPPSLPPAPEACICLKVTGQDYSRILQGCVARSGQEPETSLVVRPTFFPAPTAPRCSPPPQGPMGEQAVPMICSIRPVLWRKIPRAPSSSNPSHGGSTNQGKGLPPHAV